MKEIFIKNANKIVEALGLTGSSVKWGEMILLLIFFTLVSVLMWWVTRKIILSFIHRFAARTKTNLDDYMVDRKVFSALAHMVPLLMMDYLFEVMFYQFPSTKVFLQGANNILNVFVILIASLRFLNAVKDLLMEKENLKDKPIGSFVQLGKIIVSGFLIIIMFSIITNQDPSNLILALGASTAVLLFVFKDTILGFVASIQLAANDMVRIGDWVTVEKFGADGDVIEINLTTVKVKNFDNTITTVPTYSFISDSFRNWRGMVESDGRRIVRSVLVEAGSIQLCGPEMLEKLKKIELIKGHIDQKQDEIEKFNEEHKFDRSVLLNGRNQTNVGLFRVYIQKYLQSLDTVNQNMTLMVRQLQPTSEGLPIEVYCFSSSKDWPVYEGIIADIFDHIFAAASFFEIELFENPSGSDLRALKV